MKTLLASCAAVALMASPAFAQSTIDPQVPDSIPADPTMPEASDPMSEFQPQTEALPQELPAEPDMAEQEPPMMPDAEPTMQADVPQEDETYAEFDSEPVVTAQMGDADVSLEASVNEAELPEEYSTDDLNAVMLAKVNEVGTEIEALDAEADVWVTADGSAVDPTYAQEGQGDMDFTAEEDSFVTPEADVSMETETYESETFMTPENDVTMDDETSMEDPASTDY
ncbi:hypothetical protein [Hyphomonas sp.]|uniref:hypothetical protein n=1 Tax=Hyphomonas sp. TaxID=87 RepID=UPI0025C57E14|nr:hypothetical protein [Hyphomonas sp.]